MTPSSPSCEEQPGCRLSVSLSSSTQALLKYSSLAHSHSDTRLPGLGVFCSLPTTLLSPARSDRPSARTSHLPLASPTYHFHRLFLSTPACQPETSLSWPSSSLPSPTWPTPCCLCFCRFCVAVLLPSPKPSAFPLATRQSLGTSSYPHRHHGGGLSTLVSQAIRSRLRFTIHVNCGAFGSTLHRYHIFAALPGFNVHGGSCNNVATHAI